MRRPFLAALSAAAVLLMIALAPSATAAPSGQGLAHRNNRVCSSPAPGFAGCHAIRHDLVTAAGTVAPAATTVPAGAKGPKEIQDAYGLTGGTSKGTVAIVDAYNAPSAESDLGVYRSKYGLPACTTSNGCFKKVNQNGGSRLPRSDGGWAQEISLDLDMVSAACPSCHILLVEASTPSFANLGAAVNYAASRSDVVAISNSYGGSDSAPMSAYNHPRVAITASSGDNGYGVEAPASFPGVVAVGGTSLTGAVGSGWTQQAWSGAGSGCSTINADPGYQTGTGCSNNGKATADVSAVADPNTGVAVYDSYPYQGSSGWMQFGGTSASSPIIASAYAQGSAVAAVRGGASPSVGDYTWKHYSYGTAGSGSLTDVQGGSNGSCAQPQWCNGVSGWDGPTGLGTPNGLGAF